MIPWAHTFSNLMRQRRSGTAVAIATLAVLPLLFCLSALGDWCRLTPDSLSYLTLARSLYETGHFPLHFLQPPPGFPALIALFMALGDTPFLALRILFSLCWALSSVMTFLLYRKELGEGLAWVAGLFVAINALMLTQTTVILSEIAFLPLLLFTLAVLSCWRRGRFLGTAGIITGAAVTAALILVRSMALVVLPLMMGVLLTHRAVPLRRRLLRTTLFTLCALSPLVAWNIRQSAYPSSFNYWTMLSQARTAEDTSDTGLVLQANRMVTFGPKRLAAMKAAVLPQHLAWRAFQPPLDRASTALVGGFLLLILVIRMIRNRDPVDAYGLLTLLLLAIWPWDEGVRLVLPLFPILIADLLWAGQCCWRKCSPGSICRIGLAFALGVWLLLQGGEMATMPGRLAHAQRKAISRFDQITSLATWMKKHLPQNVALLGITPDSHESKTILGGASYLSRRPIKKYIDIRRSEVLDVPMAAYDFAFVQRSLVTDGGGRMSGIPASRFIVQDFCIITSDQTIHIMRHREADADRSDGG